MAETTVRNHIKLLSTGQLEKLNAKYYFEVDGDNIVVGLHDYDRFTLHPKDKPFHINSRSDVKRKICFNTFAINVWLKCYENKLKYSLFDVQQAVNVLTVTYQPVTEESVLRFLKQPQIKIKNL